MKHSALQSLYRYSFSFVAFKKKSSLLLVIGFAYDFFFSILMNFFLDFGDQL